jgi:K+-sensing histidine kinase KdpD
VLNYRTIGVIAVALVGAAVGIFFAWLLEITRHPSWSVLLMIVCAIAPSTIIAFYEFDVVGERRRTLVHRLRWQIAPWLKIVLTLVFVGAALLVIHLLEINPRAFWYLPLLPPIILSAIFLGLGAALFAVVVSTVIADYVYAPPAYSFAITQWQDALGLAVFAILGSLITWIIHELIYISR